MKKNVYLTLKIIGKDMFNEISVYNGDGPHYIVHQKRVSGWGMDDQWPSLFFCSTGQYGLVETAPLSTCPLLEITKKLLTTVLVCFLCDMQASFQAIDLGVDFSFVFCFT
ncbi:hypothetical protein T05_10584 [Trichinella murrelli]|uniref:Uncharacterized protein n=1 Tax=Trichinella murrelli TaxID=144512 RepID=A0A0V0TK67_9BILA|nr:hypothetical protein T05_10584 [Trichinella murrelli]